MDTAVKTNTNRQKKEAIVEELTANASKAKAIVFTNYEGLTHKQLEGFKRAIKPLDSDYIVAKNTLVLRSLEKAGIKVENPAELDGPTGTLFLFGDVVEPLKKLAKVIKEFNLPKVKFGILDHQALTSEQVLKLATLPSRETLLAQVVGGLKSPIFGLHRALNWNLQKLVMTLSAVVATKPALAVAAAPVVEPVVAEIPAPISEPESASSEPAEPETILAETVEEKQAEQPETPASEQPTENVKSEGGEN